MTIALYHMPGACSRVTMNALEEIGIDYEDRTVALMRGAQRDPAYLALNPKGKVPTLVIDGESITENPAILFYLAQSYPQAALLPRGASKIAALRGLSDLIWCGGTLHPLLHRFFRPAIYTDGGDEAAIKVIAQKALHEVANKIAPRVAGGRWWYGEAWSIVDTYLQWILDGAEAGGFPRSDYAELMDHKARVEGRPAFRRTRDREMAALRRDDLPLPPGIKS